MRLFPTVLFCLASSLLLSCVGGRQTTRVSVRGDLPRFRTAGRVTYDGYVVNVSGPGISPTVAAESIGHFAPACVDVGVSSEVLSYEKISTIGASLRLAAGPSRKVEILGVSSSLGSTILDKPVTELFAKGRVPQLYRLAIRRDLPLFRDSRLELIGSTTTETPVDILRDCTGSTLPVEDLPPESVSGVRIGLLSQNLNQNFDSLSLNQDDGRLSLLNKSQFDFIPTSAVVTPDRFRALVWNNLSGDTHTIALLSNGNFEFQGAIIPSALPTASTATFRGDSKVGYAAIGSGVQGLELENGAFTLAAYPNFEPRRQILSYGDFLFRTTEELTQASLQSNLFPSTTGTIIPNFASKYETAITSTALPQSVINSRGIYFTHITPNPMVVFLKFTGSGTDVVATGSQVSLGDSSSDVKLALSPNGKFLIARISMSGNIRIQCFVLNADGGLPGFPSSDMPGTYTVDLAVDPLSKYLILAGNNASLPFVSSYEIGSDGSLTAKGSSPAGISAFIKRMIVMPVR